MISRSKFFLFIAVSVAHATAVKSNITNGLVTDFNNGNPHFNNGAKNLKNVVSKGFTNICNLSIS